MTESTGEKTNVFRFMVVRAPTRVEPKAALRNLIEDDALTPLGRQPVDLFSTESASLIGRTVYQKVFCDDAQPVIRASDTNSMGTELFTTLIGMLESFEATCPGPTQIGRLEGLGNRATLASGTRLYVFPERLNALKTPLVSMLPEVLDILRAPPLMTDGTLDRAALTAVLRTLFDGSALANVAFNVSDGSQAEGVARRAAGALRHALSPLHPAAHRERQPREHHRRLARAARSRGARCRRGRRGRRARVLWAGEPPAGPHPEPSRPHEDVHRKSGSLRVFSSVAIGSGGRRPREIQYE